MERLYTMGLAALLALMLCGATAQDQMRLPTDAGGKEAVKKDPPPLSTDDAELVKDLALLERLELLKNLDLFEEPEQPDAGQQRQQ